jgi:hypothetical protein
MKIDTNHPTVMKFIDSVINNITTNISLKKYFKMEQEQKLSEQIKTFKLMNTSLRRDVKLDELEYKSFLTMLLRRSDEREKYELSGLIKDLNLNFKSIYEVSKPAPKKPQTRKIKTNNKTEKDE